ncbi:hypothetical protein GE21DRAFT_1346933 [Neurospora crassa]|nr:hypothetical protein GE21DRAFT_1346933 [Neurospora crassa]
MAPLGGCPLAPTDDGRELERSGWDDEGTEESLLFLHTVKSYAVAVRTTILFQVPTKPQSAISSMTAVRKLGKTADGPSSVKAGVRGPAEKNARRQRAGNSGTKKEQKPLCTHTMELLSSVHQTGQHQTPRWQNIPLALCDNPTFLPLCTIASQQITVKIKKIIASQSIPIATEVTKHPFAQQLALHASELLSQRRAR